MRKLLGQTQLHALEYHVQNMWRHHHIQLLGNNNGKSDRLYCFGNLLESPDQ